ncbi:hypothetical protein, partial [Phocaeicola plebeius]
KLMMEVGDENTWFTECLRIYNLTLFFWAQSHWFESYIFLVNVLATSGRILFHKYVFRMLLRLQGRFFRFS